MGDFVREWRAACRTDAVDVDTVRSTVKTDHRSRCKRKVSHQNAFSYVSYAGGWTRTAVHIRYTHSAWCRNGSPGACNSDMFVNCKETRSTIIILVNLPNQYSWRAEGPWRMRRHGPVIVQCTDSVIFPLLLLLFMIKIVHEVQIWHHTSRHTNGVNSIGNISLR